MPYSLGSVLKSQRRIKEVLRFSSQNRNSTYFSLSYQSEQFATVAKAVAKFCDFSRLDLDDRLTIGPWACSPAGHSPLPRLTPCRGASPFFVSAAFARKGAHPERFQAPRGFTRDRRSVA